MFFVSENDGGGEREKRHGPFFLLLHGPFCEIDIIFITYTFCIFMLFVCLFASFRPSISMAVVLLLFQMFLATCIFRDGEFPNITINVDNR